MFVSTMKKILILANTSWHIYNFRRPLISNLVNSGFQVLYATQFDKYTDKMSGFGADYVNVEYDNSSKNPLKDLLFLFKIIRILKKQKPDVLLTFTIKPNIYGGIAAQLCKIPVVANVSGLGSLFIKKGEASKLLLYLYKIGLRGADRVFFHNNADHLLFKKHNIITEQYTGVLPGSGVDLVRFSNSNANNKISGKTTFLLASRLLKDKGIVESIDAVREIQKKYNVELQLLGQLWPRNPSSISQQELDNWVDKGLVSYLGFTDDVRPYIDAADVIILPSYREGMARILLEAASMGKPLITTDVPGCRDIVDNGRTGFLCKARDPIDLAKKMIQMIELSNEERVLMGKRGREKMEKGFDEKIVINKYLETINNFIIRKSVIR